MKKTILIVLMILVSIFVMGMIQQAGSGTYQMVTANTSTATYIVVMDTRTSLVRIKEVPQCDDQRFFGEDEAQLQRYEHNKPLERIK